MIKWRHSFTNIQIYRICFFLSYHNFYLFTFALSFYFFFLVSRFRAKSKLGDRVTGLQGAGAKPPCSCSCSPWTSGTFS
nr:MAG TPA: hypothetical protein [Caudoviricetes sp.]